MESCEPGQRCCRSRERCDEYRSNQPEVSHTDVSPKSAGCVPRFPTQASPASPSFEGGAAEQSSVVKRVSILHCSSSSRPVASRLSPPLLPQKHPLSPHTHIEIP